MVWQKLTFPVSAARLPDVEDLLLAAGAVSVTLSDAHDQPILEPAPGEVPLWDECTVAALFDEHPNLDSLTAALDELLESGPGEIVQDTVQDTDWIAQWKQAQTPLHFGRSTRIWPSWMTPDDPEGVNILLDPGLAFGSGSHPTTALCLEALDGMDLTGANVLDYGCGCGVLSIAALMHGALHASGIDIDPLALQASADNACKNSLHSDTYRFCLPEDLPKQAFDVVVANILSGTLIDLADEITSRVTPGGTLLLSGILRSQAQAVQQAYAAGFNNFETVQLEDWAMLRASKVV